MCLFIGHIWILLNQVIIIRCSWGVAKNLRKPKIKLLFSKILIFMCTIYFLLSIHIIYIYSLLYLWKLPNKSPQKCITAIYILATKKVFLKPLWRAYFTSVAFGGLIFPWLCLHSFPNQQLSLFMFKKHQKLFKLFLASNFGLRTNTHTHIAWQQ